MIGIVLLNMGGPDSLQDIKPFLHNIFLDRDIIRLGWSFMQRPLAMLISSTRAKKTISAYNLIGGKSLMREITISQAIAVKKSLNIRLKKDFEVVVAMRYWHPLIEDVLNDLKSKGIKRILGISLYPQYSKATTGSIIKKFKGIAEQYGLEYAYIDKWFDNKGYIEALVENIKDSLKEFNTMPVVLFSAHSLPQKFIDEGDPYLKETQGTINEVLKLIDIDNWRLSFQSKSGPVKWLEPSTKKMLCNLASENVKNLLIVPISFISDNIETLYEIDIEYKRIADKSGINLQRISSLNTSDKFITALADLIISRLEDKNWI